MDKIADKESMKIEIPILTLQVLSTGMIWSVYSVKRSKDFVLEDVADHFLKIKIQD